MNLKDMKIGASQKITADKVKMRKDMKIGDESIGGKLSFQVVDGEYSGANRLVMWLKSDDGKGYGELTAEQAKEFVTLLKKYY